MILIDTNIFVDYLRDYGPAIEFFEGIATKEDVIFSAITEAELVSGKTCNDENKKESLLHFISSWDKILVSNKIAVLAGDITRKNNLGICDAIIAATALINDAELLTKNIKHFLVVPNLKVRIPY